MWFDSGWYAYASFAFVSRVADVSGVDVVLRLSAPLILPRRALARNSNATASDIPFIKLAGLNKRAYVLNAPSSP